MNGFPSVQYMTVCVFLISSRQKFTKQNAGHGPGQKFSRGHDPVPAAPASGRPGVIGRQVLSRGSSECRAGDRGHWAGTLPTIQKPALDLFDTVIS
jgi:hypothetical protein